MKVKKRLIPVYEAMQARFPLAFPRDKADVKPLAVGARHDLQAWVEQEQPGIEYAHVVEVMHAYCNRRSYKRALLVPGAMRISLEGEPVAPVTPEDMEHARITLEAIQRSKDAKAQREAENARLKKEADQRRAEKAALIEEQERKKAEQKRARAEAKAKAKAKAARSQAAKPVLQARSATKAKTAPVVVVKKKRRIVIPKP